MPTITNVSFHPGGLRVGTGNNIHDGHGAPLITTGHIQGGSDPIVSNGHNPLLPDQRYMITITATQDGHDKEWKGRIVAQDPTYGWTFAVIATKNKSSAAAIGSGDGDVVVTVTVTNPGGDQSPGYTPQNPVPVTSVP